MQRERPGRAGWLSRHDHALRASRFRAPPETPREKPYLLVTAGRTDQIVGWPDKLEFAAALRQAKTKSNQADRAEFTGQNRGN